MLNGRYGADKLGYVLIISSIFFTVIAAVLNSGNMFMKVLLLIVSALLLSFAVFRIFSRNTRARKREQRALEAAERKIAMLFGKQDSDCEDHENTHREEETQDVSYTEDTPEQHETEEEDSFFDEYKHFKCPRCKKPLKVPKGKGYIRIICPACGNKFTKHT